MNSSTLVTRVAESLNITPDDADRIMKAIGTSIRECCTGLDAVAIPGFGTIQPVKHNEEITTDLSTGERMLMPPSVEIEFKNSIVLRKRLVK